MQGLGAILLGDCHVLEHSYSRNCLGNSVSQLLAELAKGVLAGSSVLRATQREQTGAIAGPVEMVDMATGMVGSLLAGHTAELTYSTAARGELVHVVQEGLEGVLVLGVLLHCFSLFSGCFRAVLVEPVLYLVFVHSKLPAGYKAEEDAWKVVDQSSYQGKCDCPGHHLSGGVWGDRWKAHALTAFRRLAAFSSPASARSMRALMRARVSERE